MTKVDIFFSAKHPETNETVVVEDDGRVCFAYWWSAERKVQSSLWLYNRLPAPDSFDLSPDQTAPLNISRLVDADAAASFRMPVSEDEISVLWTNQNEAEISVCGILVGVLSAVEGSGRALLALTDGPLAKPFLSSNRLLH